MHYFCEKFSSQLHRTPGLLPARGNLGSPCAVCVYFNSFLKTQLLILLSRGNASVSLHLSKSESQAYLNHHELWIYRCPSMLSNDDNTDRMKWIESWPQKTNSGPAWEGASQKWKDKNSLVVWGNGILSELCMNVSWLNFLPPPGLLSCLLDLYSCLYLPLNWTAPPSSTFLYCSWGSQGKNAEVAWHSLFQGTTFCLLRVSWTKGNQTSRS